MEIEYLGPRSLLWEFASTLCDMAGSDTYIIDRSGKGWLTDEIVRSVVQFSPDETLTDLEILHFAYRWASKKTPEVRVSRRRKLDDFPDEFCDDSQIK